MMSSWRKSLTWKDTIKYAVSAYDFLIRGKGEMNGEQFAKEIECRYAKDERLNAITNEIREHLVCIKATYKGTYYTLND